LAAEYERLEQERLAAFAAMPPAFPAAVPRAPRSVSSAGVSRWGCTRSIQFTHSLKAPWFQPFNLKVISWFFKPLAFQIQLVPLH
jgi:hypothetical protein